MSDAPAAAITDPQSAGRYHLAQYNVARLLAPLDDPRIADFVANLHSVNQLGDRSQGLVWRHQTEDGTSTSVRVRGDPLILINFTVWESAEALFKFTYRSGHADISGHVPTVEEAEERLDYLRAHGPTQDAFTFKQRFAPPGQA